VWFDMKVIVKLISSVSLCLFTGFVGSFSTMDSVSTWYADLAKPSFNPPDWAFGVVWPILYVMMGVAAFLVWNMGIISSRTKVALGLFVFQLVLNGLWTPIFFGLHMMGLALAEIILLWIAILLTIIAFWRISKLATYLLIPYILWISFAIVLNASLWHLNR
jgi:benzodiazapine receptor